MKTKNGNTPCRHPSHRDGLEPLKFLQYQTQDTILRLVQGWWAFPEEAYGIIHCSIMLIDEGFPESREFADDLRFLRELLLTKKLMRRQLHAVINLTD
jgi:hypothetical protein